MPTNMPVAQPYSENIVRLNKVARWHKTVEHSSDAFLSDLAELQQQLTVYLQHNAIEHVASRLGVQTRTIEDIVVGLLPKHRHPVVKSMLAKKLHIGPVHGPVVQSAIQKAKDRKAKWRATFTACKTCGVIRQGRSWYCSTACREASLNVITKELS